MALPRFIEYQISPLDWACLEGGDPTCDEAYIEWSYWTQGEYLDPEDDPKAWALAVIGENPDVWVAELCRIKHDLASDTQGVAYCGLCTEYVNGRKRARAKALGPPLPGFDQGQYQLHKPCSAKALTWLRKLTYRLEQAGFLLRQRERIPDQRQARGWDWGTRLYRLDYHDN